ncbi:hypothetical protein C8R43DRAFT_1102815 [Mycena crocata]|nr:hypothetical protein C8R43DRAFT_1102815 [Mycena crocata]
MVKNITVLGPGIATLFHPEYVPSLAVFSGPSHLVPIVVPHRPVHSARLWWPIYPCSDTEQDGINTWQSAAVISALAKSSFHGGIVTLDNLFMGWPPIRTISSLASSLTLRCLYIRSRHWAYHAYKTFLGEFTAVLSEFKHLHELCIHFLTTPREGGLEISPDVAFRLAEEFPTICKWVTLCPTLRVCTLQSLIKWFRFPMTRSNYWIPLHPDQKIFASVFLKTLWFDALQSSRAWEIFHRDSIDVLSQLPRGSSLYTALRAQVIVIQSLSDLLLPLLDEA